MTLKQIVDELEPFVKSVAIGSTNEDIFSLLVRASFSKCFGFVQLASIPQSDGVFSFALAALRGVCEDLIVLGFLQGCTTEDRSILLNLLLRHETHEGIKVQHAFFSAAKPQQAVLRPAYPDQKKALENEIRSFWHKHGWPKMSTNTLPKTREIAQKQGRETLAMLYDYFFRLTSTTVHFNVGNLLRTGWGADTTNLRFDPRNFGGYYRLYAETYGLFLLCLYFEIFDAELRSTSVASTVEKIRKSLLYESMWPEMITFEELNIPRPQPGIASILMSAMQSIKTNRLLDLVQLDENQATEINPPPSPPPSPTPPPPVA